jgi:hypothetical protein
MARADELGLRPLSCWSVAEDRPLGTLLVARWFERGWQPHWMARDLADAPEPPQPPATDTAHDVVEAPGEQPPDLPYASDRPYPPASRHLAARRPDLVSRPVEPRGETLLHVAVEWDDEALVRVALARGADRSVRDRAYGGTPRDWAEQLDRPRLAALLREAP